MAGYHKKEIKKGVFGEFSKIEEEFLECKDAIEQNNPIMLLCELSDMIGAIDEFVKKYNLSIEDVIQMSQATQRAFKSGHRQ